MSKKKKKKSKEISILKEIDESLYGTHDDLLKEIEEMQLKLYYADQKARKKAKKLAKKKGGEYCDFNKLKKEARLEVVGEMEGNNFLERISKILSDITPIVIIIGRLIASLILSILSIDVVKSNIKPKTLDTMNVVFNKAMSLQS